MNIAVTKSAYTKLVRRQEKTDAVVTRLAKVVERLSHDEVLPGVAKNLEKQARLLDAGQGRRFRSMQSFRTYIRGL